jgi:hypothetical protein
MSTEPAYVKKDFAFAAIQSDGCGVHMTAGDSKLSLLASLDLQIEEVHCGQEVD